MHGVVPYEQADLTPAHRAAALPARAAVVLGAVLLAMLAVVVMAAWHLRSRDLVQILPGAAPMQYITALSFLALSGAFIGIALGRAAVSIIAALIVAAAAAVTLIQYQTGIDLWVDRIAGMPFVTDKSSHPGRMAPNTAFCFLLSAVSVFLLARRGESPLRYGAAGVVGSLIFGVGFVAIAGYALGLESAYGWANLTDMAVHTGSGFVVAAGVIVIAAWRRSVLQGASRRGWLPIAAGIAVLAVVVSLFLAVRAEHAGAPPTDHADLSIVILLFGVGLSAALAAAMFYAFHARRQADDLESEILDREAAQRETALAWNLLEDAAESVPVGLAIYGRDERMLMCNDAYWRNFYPNRTKPAALPTFADLMRHSMTTDLVPELVNATTAERGVWLEQRLDAFRAGGATLVRHLTDGRWLKIQQVDLANGNRVIVQTDITELKDREEHLLRSNSDLERFAHVASHDLREPLRKISTFSSLLAGRHGESLNDAAHDLVGRISAAATRMDTLITDLLEFASLENVDRPLQRVDLNKIVAEVQNDLDSIIEDNQARIEVSELPSIDADPLQMRQLFQNLLSNALKFRQPDEPPHIRIQWSERLDGMADLRRVAGAGSTCEITVEDNGIGFDPAYADKIFEVFHRLHGRDAYPGTGVGLGLCRRVVERLGGKISASGRPGHGATFYLQLPFIQPRTSTS